MSTPLLIREYRMANMRPSMTEGDKLRLKKDGFDFMDITDHVNLGRYTTHVTEVEASAPVLSAIGDAKLSIRTMLDGVNDTHLRLDIAHLSSFWTRNYRSRWGLLSSNWIYEKVDSVRTISVKFGIVTEFNIRRY